MSAFLSRILLLENYQLLDLLCIRSMYSHQGMDAHIHSDLA